VRQGAAVGRGVAGSAGDVPGSGQIRQAAVEKSEIRAVVSSIHIVRWSSISKI
jgi:hypothetical protein